MTNYERTDRAHRHINTLRFEQKISSKLEPKKKNMNKNLSDKILLNNSNCISKESIESFYENLI